MAIVKLAVPIAIASLLSAAPAFATGTIHCETSVRDGPEIYLVVGRGAAGSVTQMHLSGSAGQFTTGNGPTAPVISQTWLDRQELKVDVIDHNAEFHVARLIGRRAGENRYRATLRYRGRTYPMICAFED